MEFSLILALNFKTRETLKTFAQELATLAAEQQIVGVEESDSELDKYSINNNYQFIHPLAWNVKQFSKRQNIHHRSDGKCLVFESF